MDSVRVRVQLGVKVKVEVIGLPAASVAGERGAPARKRCRAGGSGSVRKASVVACVVRFAEGGGEASESGLEARAKVELIEPKGGGKGADVNAEEDVLAPFGGDSRRGLSGRSLGIPGGGRGPPGGLWAATGSGGFGQPSPYE